MLLHTDTTRSKIQQFDSEDQISINSEFNNDTDDMNEITFSLVFDDENSEDYDDEYIHENETEQEETEEEKRVIFYCLYYRYIKSFYRSVQSVPVKLFIL
jgi:hypothetical protein